MNRCSVYIDFFNDLSSENDSKGISNVVFVSSRVMKSLKLNWSHVNFDFFYLKRENQRYNSFIEPGIKVMVTAVTVYRASKTFREKSISFQSANAEFLFGSFL